MSLEKFIQEKKGSKVSNLDGLLSTRELEKERIQLSKEGKIPQGLTTGYSVLDMHFRFKQRNLVIMNGHDNVGKSFIVWYLMAIAAKKHGWRWIMFCDENQSADIRIQIVEFICGILAKFIDEEKFNKELDFVYEHFVIIDISEDDQNVVSYSYVQSIMDKVIQADGGDFNGVLIDPYNSLEINLAGFDNRLSTHDYHYSCANKMRQFKKHRNVTFWINMHAVSEALRKVDKDGYPLPPSKADTEGGGKFANRADEFITWHRYVQDAERSRTTEMHVRKVKDTKTGGKCSDLNNPIALRWENHNKFNGFYDEDGFCPLAPIVTGFKSLESLPSTGTEVSSFEAAKDAPF